MANMSDRTNVASKTMDYFLHGSSAPTAPTQPLHLRLMTTQGSNTSNGTEATTAAGYTAGGVTMGNPSFGANASGISSSANSESWTATATFPAAGPALAIEIWDTTGTPIRLLQGAITSVALANGNTLTFAAASITADASAW
jgi:hypothetical protein